jgi:hypothetical protein
MDLHYGSDVPYYQVGQTEFKKRSVLWCQHVADLEDGGHGEGHE